VQEWHLLAKVLIKRLHEAGQENELETETFNVPVIASLRMALKERYPIIAG